MSDSSQQRLKWFSLLLHQSVSVSHQWVQFCICCLSCCSPLCAVRIRTTMAFPATPWWISGTWGWASSSASRSLWLSEERLSTTCRTTGESPSEHRISWHKSGSDVDPLRNHHTRSLWGHFKTNFFSPYDQWWSPTGTVTAALVISHPRLHLSLMFSLWLIIDCLYKERGKPSHSALLQNEPRQCT